MKNIIVKSKNETHEFQADGALFDITLQIIRDHQIIAEFFDWEYWYYVD